MTTPVDDPLDSWGAVGSVLGRRMRQVISGLIAAATIAAFLCIHWCLDQVAALLLADLPRVRTIARALFAIGYVAAECSLVWDMLGIFFPRLRLGRGILSVSWPNAASTGEPGPPPLEN
jgi:hypothetical protein